MNNAISGAAKEAAEALFTQQTHPRIPLASTRQNAAVIIQQVIDAEVSDRLKVVVDFAEWGWGIIANASGGNWEKESKEWQTAAAKYRDDFFNTIRVLTDREYAKGETVDSLTA